MFDDFKPEDVAWIILFLPLLAAAGIALFTKRDGKFSAQISIAAVALTFLVKSAMPAAASSGRNRIIQATSSGLKSSNMSKV